eukprot:6200160-Pleurochrysis_carterae.AAC.5
MPRQHRKKKAVQPASKKREATERRIASLTTNRMRVKMKKPAADACCCPAAQAIYSIQLDMSDRRALKRIPAKKSYMDGGLFLVKYVMVMVISPLARISYWLAWGDEELEYRLAARNETGTARETQGEQGSKGACSWTIQLLRGKQLYQPPAIY